MKEHVMRGLDVFAAVALVFTGVVAIVKGEIEPWSFASVCVLMASLYMTRATT